MDAPCRRGDASAQLKLGTMYDKGVPHTIMLFWYTRAAEQANADAQFSLGVMYHKGKGVLQDYNIAAKWYQLAAEQASAQAQFYLGVMYHRSVRQCSMTQLVEFDLPNRNASEIKAIVAKRMTPQISPKHDSSPVNVSLRITKGVDLL